jgi:hypothetical protein
MCARRFVVSSLLLSVIVQACLAQQVQRSTVGFENFFYEADPTEDFATLTFIASRQDEYDVEVSFQTLDGTALAGRDYIATNGTFVFPAGSTNRYRDIHIPLLKHELSEERTFSVKLNSFFPAEVSRTRGEVNVTILGRPDLRIFRFETNVILSWRASATNFVLESAPSLTGTWASVNGTPRPIEFEPRQTLTLPRSPESTFFRLRDPE